MDLSQDDRKLENYRLLLYNHSCFAGVNGQKGKEMLRSIKQMRLKNRLVHAFQQSALPELPSGSLDPDYELLQQLTQSFQRESNPKPLSAKSIRELRSDARMQVLIESQFALSAPPLPEIWHETIPTTGGSVPVRIYLPASRGPHPILIYLHRGGWCYGDLDTTHDSALRIAHHTGWVVITVDYRLSPEYAFPAALQDAFAVLKWASQPENALPMRGNPQQIVLCGEGAGGNLAAALCLMNRDRQGPPIASQVLIDPILDLLHTDRISYQRYAAGYDLTPADVSFFIQQYIHDPVLAMDPIISPLLSPDLANLPPALIVSAELSILRSEGEEYVQKLQQARVPVRHWLAIGLKHGFFSQQHVLPRAHFYAGHIYDMMTGMISTTDNTPQDKP